LLKISKERKMKPMEQLLKILKDDSGASAVEYALLVALITAVIVSAVTLLGGNLKATFDYVATIVLKP
jgi:pilus assembly protein Flp/PilA